MTAMGYGAIGGTALSALAIAQGNKDIARQANASMQATAQSYLIQSLQMKDLSASQVSNARMDMTNVNFSADKIDSMITNKIANTNISGNLATRLLTQSEMDRKLAMDNAKSELDNLVYSTNMELKNLKYQTDDAMYQTALNAKYGMTTGWKAVAGMAQGAASGASLAGSFNKK